MSTATVKVVFDRKKKATATKRAAVYVEVGYMRKHKYISTGVSVLPSQWDEQAYVINTTEAPSMNNKIAGIASRVRKFVTDMEFSKEGFSFASLDKYLDVDAGKMDSFLEWLHTQVMEADINESTRRQHIVMLDDLCSWGLMKTFADVNLDMIREYDKHVSSKGICQVTVYGYHRKLRKYVNIAYKEGLIKTNPYDRFSAKHGKSKPREFLDDEELDKLMSIDIYDEHLSYVRDIFAFQCLTGLSYEDLFSDTRQFVYRNNSTYIIGRRMKTSSEYYIKLMKPAEEILSRNNGELKRITLEHYNRMLKSLAPACGIRKHLTTHVGRHTFATFALNHGMPIEVVSKILGHTNIRTTQIYAKIVNKTIDAEFDKLEYVVTKKATSYMPVAW